MSVSGLTYPQRILARHAAVRAALLSLHHAEALHYTQGAQRWEGIDHHDVAARGDYPKHADCSSFATWCLWNGLHVPFGVDDDVNGLEWKAGYTGTMVKGGREVMHLENVVRADCVLYGTKTPEHVAIVVGHKGDKPVVVSNGSEPGPFLLPYDYRSDVLQVRRYI